MIATETESNKLREVTIDAVREIFANVVNPPDQTQEREFNEFFDTALGHTLLRGICGGYRLGFSDGSVSTRLQLKDNSQKALDKLVKPSPTVDGTTVYHKGFSDGFDAARRLLRDDARKVIVRILRQHSAWNAKEICDALDSRGIELPLTLAKQTGIRLWAEAIDVRRSALSRRVEKYISRVRIAIRVVNNEKKWRSRLERKEASSTS
jgi:hypothetical protein